MGMPCFIFVSELSINPAIKTVSPSFAKSHVETEVEVTVGIPEVSMVAELMAGFTLSRILSFSSI